MAPGARSSRLPYLTSGAVKVSRIDLHTCRRFKRASVDFFKYACNIVHTKISAATCSLHTPLHHKRRDTRFRGNESVYLTRHAISKKKGQKKTTVESTFRQRVRGVETINPRAYQCRGFSRFPWPLNPLMRASTKGNTFSHDKLGAHEHAFTPPSHSTRPRPIRRASTTQSRSCPRGTHRTYAPCT